MSGKMHLFEVKKVITNYIQAANLLYNLWCLGLIIKHRFDINL